MKISLIKSQTWSTKCCSLNRQIRWRETYSTQPSMEVLVVLRDPLFFHTKTYCKNRVLVNNAAFAFCSQHTVLPAYNSICQKQVVDSARFRIGIFTKSTIKGTVKIKLIHKTLFQFCSNTVFRLVRTFSNF